MPLLRRHRVRQIAVGQLPLHHEGHAHRRRAADHLGEDGDDVVECRGVADATVPPAVVRAARPRRRARLSFGRKARLQGDADRLQSEHEQRILVVVERIAQRRRPQHRTRRAALMVVIEDLREPLVVQHAVDVFGLGLRRGEEVAVVVVADVLLVQLRQVRQAPLLGIRRTHVPVRNQIVAVRIGMHEEDDHVVQNPHRLFIGAADHLVDHLAELLGAERFTGMQPAVNPDDGLPVLGERARLCIRQVLGQRESPRDVFVPSEVRVVLRRRHDRHELRTPLGGLADVLHRDARRFSGQLVPIRRDLLVVREEIVLAEVVAELLLRAGDAGLRADVDRPVHDEGRHQQREQGYTS